MNDLDLSYLIVHGLTITRSRKQLARVLDQREAEERATDGTAMTSYKLAHMPFEVDGQSVYEQMSSGGMSEELERLLKE